MVPRHVTNAIIPIMPDESEFIPFNSPEGRDVELVYELAKNIRAPFIEQAISIERIIDGIIARHFCPIEELQQQFLSVILGDRMTFSEKINILETVLRDSYYDFYQKHKKLKQELTQIRQFRNRLAHSLLDTSTKFLEQKHRDRIQLLYYKDGRTKQHVITVVDVDFRLRACSAVLMVLIELQREVSKGAAQL